MSEIYTYWLVAQWSAFWLVLIFSIIMNLNSKSTDFSNTFPKADMELYPVYI